MKVLFAVSDEETVEKIKKRYKDEYKEILSSSKNVYYFNAILKEIQKDKTYDRIVISEDLESFSNNNYEAIDKFIFEKLDSISDEAQDVDGNAAPIILICSDRHAKGSSFLVKLFGIGIYNALLGNERSLDQVCKLINKPRSKKDAKAYYKVDADEVNYDNSNEAEVSEKEIQSILAYFKKLTPEKYADSFNNIVPQYTEEQLKIIINCLPISVKANLERNCKKYQEIIATNGIPKVALNKVQEKNQQSQKETGIKIDIIEKKILEPKISGNIVIPASVKNAKNKGPVMANKSTGTERKLEIPIEKREELRNKKIVKRVEPTSVEKAEKKVENVAKIMAKRENAPATEKIVKKVKPTSIDDVVSNTGNKDRSRLERRPVVDKTGVDIKQKQVAEPQNRIQKPVNPVVKKEPVSQTESPLKPKSVMPKPPVENIPDLPVEEENVAERKGRGRPRKTPIDAVPKPKGKRGRPRKYGEAEDYEEEIEDDVFLPGMDEEYEDEILPGMDDEFETEENSLPGMDEEVEVEEDSLPEMDEEFDDETLPGMDYEFDEEESSMPIMDENDYEDEEDSLPGMDEEYEDEEDSLPGMDEEFEVEEDSLPGMDEEYEDEEDSLPGMDEEYEDEEDSLPGMDEEFEVEEDSSSEEYEEYEEYEDEDSLPGMDEEFEVEEDLSSEEYEEYEEYEDEEDSLPGMDEEFEVEEDVEYVEDDSIESDEVEEYTDEVILPDLDDLDDFDNTEKIDNVLPEVEDDSDEFLGFEEDDAQQVQSTNNNYNKNTTNKIESIKPKVDYSMSSLNSLLTKDKKIVTFIGTTKNGTSFLINNLAALFSSLGINTAILDMTKNRNSYYIYTKNEEELRNIAYNSISKLQKGFAEGIKADKNLTVYTALPNDGKDYSDAESILSTLVQNHSLVLIDCDFDTDPAYFASCQEIYLVQSMDILTIQPLTAFLRDLKSQGVLESEKVRVVINKELKVKNLTTKTIIGGMSFYNDPSMSFMTELFNKDMVKACTIPFDESAYSKYLYSMANCNVSVSGYTKNFLGKLRNLGDMVYPLVSKSTYGKSSPQQLNNYGTNFSNNTNGTLNQMKRKF